MSNKKHALQYRLWLGFFILLLITFFSPSSFACTSPSGIAGEMYYNETDDVMEYCNGTSWIDMGPSPGAGGAGCTTPTGSAGAMLYNTVTSVMQYCDGAAWVDINILRSPSTLGLVGHWPLNETSGSTISDSSTTANDGTWTDGVDNNVSGETTTGAVDDALDFDGSDDVIDIPLDTAYGTTSFTMSAWVYFDSSIPSGWRVILEHDRFGLNWYGLFKSSTSTGFHCRWGPNPYSQDFSTTIVADTWYHLACTYDSSSDTVRMYLDGVLDTEIITTGASLTVSADIITIGENQSGGENFNGIIDDVRLYNRALSPSEVQDLYAAKNNGGCVNPTGVEGEMFYDSTGNAMRYCNGTIWGAID